MCLLNTIVEKRFTSKSKVTYVIMIILTIMHLLIIQAGSPAQFEALGLRVATRWGVVNAKALAQPARHFVLVAPTTRYRASRFPLRSDTAIMHSFYFFPACEGQRRVGWIWSRAAEELKPQDSGLRTAFRPGFQ